VPSFTQILTWLESTRVAIFVSQSSYGFGVLEMIHVAAISVVVGMIAVLDLRLLGLASNNCKVTELYRDVIPITWAAFAVALPTGLLMFIGQATKYTANIAFQLKIALLVLTFINMLMFRWFVFPRVAAWDHDAAVPLAGKIAGAVSLLSWVAIVAAARWIGYFMLR
jgi:hypothetical protein